MNATIQPTQQETAEEKYNRLRERVVEAMSWLSVHAPGRAYDALEQALQDQPPASN